MQKQHLKSNKLDRIICNICLKEILAKEEELHTNICIERIMQQKELSNTDKKLAELSSKITKKITMISQKIKTPLGIVRRAFNPAMVQSPVIRSRLSSIDSPFDPKDKKVYTFK